MGYKQMQPEEVTAILNEHSYLDHDNWRYDEDANNFQAEYHSDPPNDRDFYHDKELENFAAIAVAEKLVRDDGDWRMEC